MKILLVHGYFLKRDIHEQKVMKPYPPLGLLYLSATLKAANYQVRVFDGTFADFEDFKKELKSFQPRVIGFYANMMTRHNILELYDQINDPNIMTIVGGPDPPHYADAYLDRGFEAVIVGEGEGPFLRLLEHLDDFEAWSQIPGLIYRHDNETIKTATVKPKTPLDQFPFPDRKAIALDLYLDCWEKHHGMRPISLITSRGCPFQCTWCSHNVYGYSLRKRTPANVMEEMEWLSQNYDFNAYWFADDVFTIQNPWTLAFRDLLLQNPKLIKPFECISRADKLSKEVVEALKDMRCKRLWVGAESGSQRLLDLMKRGVKRDQVIAAVKNLRAAGIQSGMFFMWGFMDETIEDVLETVSLAKACAPDIALTTIAYPIRGTRFFQQLEKHQRIAEPLGFNQGTDRDIQIKNQADPNLYALADRYLHAVLGATQISRGPLIRRLKAVIHYGRGRSILKKLKQGFALHQAQFQKLSETGRHPS